MQNHASKTLPRWLSWLFVVIFLLHFGAVLIYQFGMGVLPKVITSQVDRYILPWFYQNYTMFAPDPDDQLNTFVYRVKCDGEWSDWKDPVFPHYQRAWSNRFGTGTDEFRIMDGIGDALFNGVHYTNFIEEPTDEQWFAIPGFKIAERYILREHDGCGLESFEVGVLNEYHRVDDGQIKKMEFFWKYPVKEVAE